MQFIFDKFLFPLQSILKSLKMNVITLVSNCYLNPLITPQLAYLPTNIRISPLLTILSQALKTSIICYQNGLPSDKEKDNNERKGELLTEEIKQTDQQLMEYQKEVQKITIKNIKPQSLQSELKEVFRVEVAQKPGKQSNQLITNNFVQQKEEESQGGKKTRELSRRIKKAKNMRKKNHNRLKVQNINLLECADAPRLGISIQDLNIRKERLLERMVKVWDQKFKDRKDRREIRMLNL